MQLPPDEVTKLEVFPSRLRKRERIIAIYAMASGFFLISCIIYAQAHYSHLATSETDSNTASLGSLMMAAISIVGGLAYAKARDGNYIFTDKRMLAQDRSGNITLSIPYENITYVSFKDYPKTYRYNGLGGDTGYLVFLLLSCLKGIALVRKVYKTGHYKPDIKPYGGIVLTYKDETGEHTLELENIEQQEKICREINNQIAGRVSTFRTAYL